MTEPDAVSSFRLGVRPDRNQASRRRWLYIPLEIVGKVTLAMVPNTMASRSRMTPAAAHRLRIQGLLGADIVDLTTRGTSAVVQGVQIAGRTIPDLDVRVREVKPLRGVGGEHIVDGYLGLDFFFGYFRRITIDTRMLRVTLRPDR